MRVCLFNIADYLMPYENFISLSSGYLKSYFEKYSKYRDNIEISVEYEDILDRLLDKKPEVVGISVATEFYNRAVKVAERIKYFLPLTIIVIGGYHITNLPESLNPIFDFGVVGEGEQTFLELVEAIYRGSGDFSSIAGLIYYKPKLTHTEQRELIPNLWDIPQPYRGVNRGVYTNLITSRGCPYACTFCCSTVFWRRTIRYNSPEAVIDEMLYIAEGLGIKHISIWDDLFIGNMTRLRRINELMRKNKILRKVTFGVSARASLVSKEVLDIFKQMNVLRVSIGFESGSDRMLELMKGKGASVKSNRKALDLLNRYPFFVEGGFIIGSPYETIGDIKQTWEFIRTSGLNGGYAVVAIPFPGTSYWDYAKGKNLVSNNMDFGVLKNMTDFEALRDEPFILLAEVDRNQFLDYGEKMARYFKQRQRFSYFDIRKITLKHIRTYLRWKGIPI